MDKAMNWISVKDRLPEPGVDVSLRHEIRWETFKGFIDEKGEWSVYYKDHPVKQPAGITHWMPLPEPTKE